MATTKIECIRSVGSYKVGEHYEFDESVAVVLIRNGTFKRTIDTKPKPKPKTKGISDGTN